MNKKERQEYEEKILKDLSVERQGKKLIVPEGVELSIAVKALQLKQEEEEEFNAVSWDFEYGVAEGMVAFLRTLEKQFGFVSARPTPTFFGNRPPQFLGIETAPGHQESVPFGRLNVPGINGWLEPTYNIKKGKVVFKIHGEIKGKHRVKADVIIEAVRRECKDNSIYKGQAIETSFPEIEDLNSLGDTFPTFAKLNKIDLDDIIFSKVVSDKIMVSLFMPIMHSERCRKHEVPLKRGILLEGPYGVGKTLTAAATAALCKENNWTFIYLKDVTKLAQAYSFAEQYQPAVIFAEDIDQIVKNKDPEHRDDEINNVLNALDGIDSKGIEVITVLTTNNVQNLTKAMLRPGRLDTVVSVRPPDADAAQQLVRLFGGDLIAADEDLSSVGDILKGEIPALIREVVERSKLAAMRREQEDENLRIVAEDIKVTAEGMKDHMNLLKKKDPDNRSEREKAAGVIASATVAAEQIKQGKDIKEVLEDLPDLKRATQKPDELPFAN